LEIAYALQENLEREAEITGTQSIFQMSASELFDSRGQNVIEANPQFKINAVR
jgi:hypothetical protein